MIPLAGKKSKTAKEALMKYLRSFYKRHRGMAALALFLLLGQVVGTLLIPALIANVVDLGILPGDMDAILRTGGQMLAVALLSAAVAAAGSWVTADLGARFGFEMRSLLLRKSQELSLHQFDEVGVSSADHPHHLRHHQPAADHGDGAPDGGARSPHCRRVHRDDRHGHPGHGRHTGGLYGGAGGGGRRGAPKVQRPLPQHPGAPGPHQPCGAGGGHRRAGDPGLRQ